MRLGPLRFGIDAGLIAAHSLAIYRPSSPWPAGGDPETFALLGGGSVTGGSIELAGPSLAPGGSPTGGPVYRFVPDPGQTMVITGPPIDAPANGNRSPNPRIRYAYGVCRDLGADPPSGPKPIKYILQATNTAGGSGHKDLAFAEPRYSGANAGGAPVDVMSNSGIVTAGSRAWGTPANPQSHGTAGCGIACSGWVGGCRNVWQEWSIAVTVSAGGAGERVTYQHVLEISAAAMVQLVVNTP